MLAVPLAKLALGVKVTVRVRPLPLMALSEPPVASTSPTVPFQAKLLPGSSENVKVMMADSSFFNVEKLDVMPTEGDAVSTRYKTLSASLALPNAKALPAALLNVLPLRLTASVGMEMPLVSSCPNRMV